MTAGFPVNSPTATGNWCGSSSKRRTSASCTPGFERLKGRRRHQRSLRLNRQFRLIVEVEARPGGNLIALKSIEDYH